MSAPDISPPEVLATYYRPINNVVIQLMAKDKYRVMTMSSQDRPPPHVRDALVEHCSHAKCVTSVGECANYGQGFNWKLTMLRISQTQFLVKFSPPVRELEGSDPVATD